MTCYRPLPAYRERGGGRPMIGLSARSELGDKLELPCGHCLGCQKDRAFAWSLRVMHEAQLYDSNWFATFDYSPECLPASRSLEYTDFQSFLKRLRKTVKGVSVAPDGRRPVRFFVAGEYGARYGRPHWHAILFNARFGDEYRFLNGTYRSERAESLWSKGRVVLGSVTPQSAAYVAGYTLSKVYGRDSADHYEDVVNLGTGEVTGRRPEFCVMSRRPGIGAWWYERFGGDLFPADVAITAQGRRGKVPRYYWEKYRIEGDQLRVEEIEHARFLRAQALDPAESTIERREVREQAARAMDAGLYGQRGF